MGLGLPLANRIVERHRGALRLLEPEKPGNRVEIHLPTLEKAHANDTRD
jgi:nitrogen fixation/metabolism regulation signal transduction histidine kinase